MNVIILLTGIVLAIVLLVMFLFGERRTRKNIEKIHQDIARAELPTVSAGSHFKNIPVSKETVSTIHNAFVNEHGLKLDTKEFNGYLVQGDSMQYCDIFTGDVVFSPKGFRPDNLNKFPSIVILRNSSATPEQCQFKMRRAWRITTDSLSDNEFDNLITDIMASPDYLTLKEKARNIYSSDDEMISDFRTKLSIYKKDRKKTSEPESIVISSTYDVDAKKIRFSIHRTSSLIGLVKYVASVSHPINQQD